MAGRRLGDAQLVGRRDRAGADVGAYDPELPTRAGMWRAPFMLGLDGMGRMSKAMSAADGFHKQVERPHWYLMTVGPRTVRQTATDTP